MEEKESQRGMKRRNVLKSSGAAVTFCTGMVTARGNAKPGFQEVLKQSHQILQESGIEGQHEYLKSRGITTAKDSSVYQMPAEKQQDPSIQKLKPSEISLWFSLFNDCGTGSWPDGTFVAALSWEHDSNWDDPGRLPMDYAGIGWDDNTWDYERTTRHRSRLL